MRLILAAALVLQIGIIHSTTFAQESTTKWAHESEASVVLTSGNTNTETYSAKQTTSFSFDKNALIAKARYLLSKDQQKEKARNWDASLRYEREITDRVSAFLQQTAEADEFAGTIQRNSTDIGGKYFFVKSDSENLFSELGYRYTFEDKAPPTADAQSHFARLYAEWNRKWTATLSHKLWAEYLPNFTDEEDYLIKGEPSVSAILTDIFSLKTGYLLTYRNAAPKGKERLDTLFSTALVAKF